MVLLAASAGLTMGLISPFMQVLFTPQAVPASGPAAGPPAAQAPPGPAADASPGMATPPSAPRTAGEAVSRALGTTRWGNLDRWPGFLKGVLDRFIFQGSPF